MFEHFRDYMYYLLTAPYKRIRKGINQWYILFTVLGGRLDSALEGIGAVYDETMIATCSPELLQTHADDRLLTRYPGEDDENFRRRIANYPEICRLGGSDEGVLRAVRTLGFADARIVKANDYTGHYTLDGSWECDGSKLLDSQDDRWAEFYLVIRMDVDEVQPISTDILKRHVRKWKYTTAKDNYCFRYGLTVEEPHTVSSRADYRWMIFFFNYRRLDGKWNLDGSIFLDSDRSSYPVKIGFRYHEYETFPHEAALVSDGHTVRAPRLNEQAGMNCTDRIRLYFSGVKSLNGCWMLDGETSLGPEAEPYPVSDGYRTKLFNEEWVGRVKMRRTFDPYHLDGEWLLDGVKLLDAIDEETIMGGTHAGI